MTVNMQFGDIQELETSFRANVLFKFGGSEDADVFPGSRLPADVPGRAPGTADRAVPGALQPAGKQPAPHLVAMREWFTSLSGDDKEMLGEVVRHAADFAIFGMLCLLDNVHPVVDGYRETLELFVRANNELRKLTDEGEELHDLFRSRVDESAGWDA